MNNHIILKLNLTQVNSIRLRQDSHAILGYINPNGFLPSPVITIIEEADTSFAIFPDLTIARIVDFEENKKSLDNLELPRKGTTISNGQYSYCIAKGSYITGSPLNVMLQLVETLKHDFEYSKHKNHLEIISEFITNDDLSKILTQSKLDYPTCLLLSKHLPILKIILNKRKRKNKEVASRVLVQYIYSNQIKTVYKKNLTYTPEVSLIDFKPKTLRALTNAIATAIRSNADKIKPLLIPKNLKLT